MITPPDKKLKGNSKNWRNHESKWLLTTCDVCKDVHGKIYELDIKKREYIKHPFCQCEAPTMRIKSAGTATQKGTDGADFYLKYLKKLPSYYITKDEAKEDGWQSIFEFISDSSPGKMIGGVIFIIPKENFLRVQAEHGEKLI